MHPLRSSLKRNAAFTLAEVLITLGIIGVVAAITLPSLIADFQDKQLIAQFKKTYSIISNSVLLAQQDLGTIGDNTRLFDVNKTSEEVAINFSRYFNGASVCKSASDKGCGTYSYKVKFATPYTAGTGENQMYTLNYPLLLLADGAVLQIRQFSDCHRVEYGYETEENGDYKLDADGNKIPVEIQRTTCAIIDFDVNGPRMPNQYGRDVYEIAVEEDKIKPTDWNQAGAASLRNILSGKDELYYEAHSVKK